MGSGTCLLCQPRFCCYPSAFHTELPLSRRFHSFCLLQTFMCSSKLYSPHSPLIQEHSHLHASLKLPAKLEGWMRSPCPYCTGHVPLTVGHCPGTHLCALMGSVGWGHMHLILSCISSTWQVLNMCLLYERLAGGPDHKEFGLLPGGIRHHRGF